LKLHTFLAYKALVFGLAFVGLAAVANIWPESLGHFLGLLFEWDAKHILRVARDGYLAQEPSIQIYPVVPLLIRLFQLFMRDWNAAAVLATQVCSYFAFHYFHMLARLDLDKEQATTALILFAFFPTAYFLTAPYTEAAFCALVFATVYHMRVKRWVPAAVLAALAAATRVTGILLGAALAAQAWHALRPKLSKRELRGLAFVAAGVALGFASYLALNKSLYGSWLYFLGEQGKHWGIHLSYPFKGAVEAIRAWPTRVPADKMSVVVLELGFMAVALALVPAVWRRRNSFDTAWVCANLLLLLSLDFWLSRPRYVLTLYPIFLAVAPWLTGRPLALAMYLLGSASLLGIYWAQYLSAKWAF
jgi:hypothetical protein